MNISSNHEQEAEVYIAALIEFIDRRLSKNPVGPRNRTRVTIWGRHQSKPNVNNYDPDDNTWRSAQESVRAHYENGGWETVVFVDKKRESGGWYFSCALMESLELPVTVKWHSYVKFTGRPFASSSTDTDRAGVG